MEIFEFNEQKCRDAKYKIGKCAALTEIWKKYNPGPVIGNCTDLFRILKPTSIADFYQKYIDNGEKYKDELDVEKRGCSYEEFYNLAVSYKNDELAAGLDVNFSIEDYFYCIICHAVVETYDGQLRENEFDDYMKRTGYGCKIERVKGKADGKYGIDRLVTMPNGAKMAIQIKPISFFSKYTKKGDLKKDQRALIKKYDLTKKEYKIPTYYAVYETLRDGSSRWLANNNGGICHKIGEFMDREGNIKDFKRVFKDIKPTQVISCY